MDFCVRDDDGGKHSVHAYVGDGHRRLCRSVIANGITDDSCELFLFDHSCRPHLLRPRAFNVGSIVYFFPKHLIIGAVGGIGVFVIQTGISNATGLAVDISTLSSLASLVASWKVIGQWALPVALVGLLMTLTRTFRICHSPFFPPAFFLSIPPLFYCVLALGGIPVSLARHHGWVLTLLAMLPWNGMPCGRSGTFHS